MYFSVLTNRTQAGVVDVWDAKAVCTGLRRSGTLCLLRPLPSVPVNADGLCAP